MEVKTSSLPNLVEGQWTDPATIQIQPLHKQPFVSALLFLKGLLKEIIAANTDNSIFDTPSSLLDTFHFGMFSYQLTKLKEAGHLLTAIKERRHELQIQKEHWLPFIEVMKHGEDREFYSRVESVLKEGRLISNPAGLGGSYFVVNAQGPCYLIKPVDHDIFCLNNPKEFGSPFHDEEHRARDDIPLYRSAQTDAFCWEVAQLADLQETTPKTVMGIFHDENFYDFSSWLDEDMSAPLIQKTGIPDKEKLCSVQEFIPDSRDLNDLLHQFYAEELTDEEIAGCFDQKDFEEVCMFLWLCGDTDAHSSNFLTYVKRIEETGKKIYGIKKIDNGLSFPEKNTQYINILAWAPNAVMPISTELKQKIALVPMEKIQMRMDAYELTNCKEAFNERVKVLKDLSLREGITIGEIDLRLSLLSRKGGREAALSSMTTQEVLDLIIGKQSTTGDSA